ncbi:MAG: hypothetical protein JW869_07370, partial [Candidatus Omnitrophica bacterium]|nr:hypothetical protein [Candidatus Omnitrophota bacterium]
MKRIILFSALVGFFLFAGDKLCAQGTDSPFGADGKIPRPMLKEPTREVVEITGGTGIRFRWNPRGISRGFIFAIYEGLEMYDENLIYKKKLSGAKREIFIEKEKFKSGLSYTWSIRQKNNR